MEQHQMLRKENVNIVMCKVFVLLVLFLKGVLGKFE
ncbi:hypothetical protein F383_23832 [Gossypium arboreum]|uniref:Uncharacterized protein n=1 Tax=Gossypium arboreum TaxID=29729 RepID=A0A0B0P3D5_GOSAR|nr:hypothetical protein F383_23832 [Gossypium arboreum]